MLVLSHDRLESNPSLPRNVRHSFHIMHQHMAHSVQALAQVVCKRGLIQLSFADVRSLYGRYQGTEALENCWIAHVDGDIHDTVEELIEKLFNGPLLADESVWKLIDHAIVAVSGTRDLGLSDVQEMVGRFSKAAPDRYRHRHQRKPRRRGARSRAHDGALGHDRAGSPRASTANPTPSRPRRSPCRA